MLNWLWMDKYTSLAWKVEKAMAPHSSTLAWKIPWAEEPGGLQSMGSQRVGHDWAISLSLFTCMHWRRKWQPTPVFLPGESQGRGSLVGCRLWMGSHRVGHDWSDLAAAAAQLTHWLGLTSLVRLFCLPQTPKLWLALSLSKPIQNTLSLSKPIQNTLS